MLVAGLGMEVAVVSVALKSRKEQTPEQERKTKHRIEVLAVIAALLVLLAIIGERLVSNHEESEKQKSRMNFNELSNRLSETKAELNRANSAFKQLEESQKDRSITKEQREKLSALLKDAPKGNVWIESNATDTEAQHFVSEMGQAFRFLGFSVTENASIQNSVPKLVVLVRSGIPVPSHAQAVLEALNGIGLNPVYGSQPFVRSNFVYINVGAKPSPLK